MRSFLTAPGVNVEETCRLVFTPTDQLCAIGALIGNAAPYVRMRGKVIVAQDEQGKGIGSSLHDWIESIARESVSKAPEDARVYLVQLVMDDDPCAMAFLVGAGYSQARHFWRMTSELNSELPAVIWPHGIRLQTVDLRIDLEAPSRALSEAFRDHYGHVDDDVEKQLERQKHSLSNDPDYMPELSFLAMDGDEIAGVCLCSPKLGTDAMVGYVDTLGVRRPWRKRGLGLSLLHHAFRVLRGMGKERVSLHVDAQSLTGATRLYEKAGMHVDQLAHEYQLELRSGVDLARQ